MLLNTRIPVSYIFSKVKTELLVVFILSLAVLFITARFEYLLPNMPLQIVTFLGTAISILLSFKLSQSYDRWWEARKVWGAIVNDSRSLVIQLQTLMSKDQPDAVKRIAYRQIAWCYSLGAALRGLDPLSGLSQFLSEADIKEISQHQNKPLALLSVMGREIKLLREAGNLELFAQIQLDDTLVRLCDSQGKAERIKSTVFPVTYRMFLHFLIYIFVVALSVALKYVQWYFEIPLLIIISAAFFLLEKSATNLQDPFENRASDTAMTTISRNIEINIRQLLGEKEVPPPYPPDKFYLK